MIASHPTWMYSQEGARHFEAGEEIPEGWVDSPEKVASAEKVVPSEPVTETPRASTKPNRSRAS